MRSLPPLGAAWGLFHAARARPHMRGLIGAWIFGAGFTSIGDWIPDWSGYGQHGVIQNSVSWATSRPGPYVPMHARTLDGAGGLNDRIDIPFSANQPIFSHMQGNAAFSLIAWVNWDTASNFGGIIGSRYTNGFLFSDGDNTDSLALFIDGDRFNTPANTLPTNTWTHCAATYTGETVRIYVNGIEEYSESGLSGLNMDNVESVQLFEARSGVNWNGLIHSVLMFNRALSGAEILRDYTHPFRDLRPIPGVMATAVAAGGRIMGSLAGAGGLAGLGGIAGKGGGLAG